MRRTPAKREFPRNMRALTKASFASSPLLRVALFVEIRYDRTLGEPKLLYGAAKEPPCGMGRIVWSRYSEVWPWTVESSKRRRKGYQHILRHVLRRWICDLSSAQGESAAWSGPNVARSGTQQTRRSYLEPFK